jgi:hypothetical protein
MRTDHERARGVRRLASAAADEPRRISTQRTHPRTSFCGSQSARTRGAPASRSATTARRSGPGRTSGLHGGRVNTYVGVRSSRHNQKGDEEINGKSPRSADDRVHGAREAARKC